MNNPFKRMTKREWALWFVSIAIVVMSNIMAGRVDALTLTATCIGVTSLIFAAQGNVWAPILMTIFCIQYAIISYRFRYWGEMFTYLFMSLPMSVWSIVTWLKNARNSSDGTVEIRKITRKGAGVLVLCNVAVTIAFYILLKKLNTPNLIFSTISVVTSFFAASLTMLRSSYYALGLMASFSKKTGMFLSFSWRMYFRQSSVFLANRLMDLVIIMSMFSASQSSIIHCLCICVRACRCKDICEMPRIFGCQTKCSQCIGYDI